MDHPWQPFGVMWVGYDGLLGKEIVLSDALSFLELEMPCLNFHRQPVCVPSSFIVNIVPAL